jgi:hypothetical protein
MKGKVVDNFDCLYLDVNFANPDGQSKVFQEIPEGWTAFVRPAFGLAGSLAHPRLTHASHPCSSTP